MKITASVAGHNKAVKNMATGFFMALPSRDITVWQTSI